jgi:putative colanic acid biosynthesis UDP-glucose lipid carrier transferase
MLPVFSDPKKLDNFISHVVEYVRGSDVEEIIVGVDAERWGDLKKLLAGLRVLPLPVSLIPVGMAADVLGYPTRLMGDTLCIELHRGPLGAFERGVKRSIDVLSAIAGLLLFLPLLTIVAVLIKLDSPGPILFLQRRCGFNGRPFQILKFRTMSVLEDGPTVCQATESDCRITRLGRWLRRTSIDELPQLLNVLNGTMSLVGPRPHALAHDNHFDKVVSNYAFRHHVKPGLTGWAQVNGLRGPTPTVADIQRRVQFDLWYIDNWSLRLDLLIIVKTIAEVMRSRNAY